MALTNSNSIITLSLKQPDLYISVFPQKVVFGTFDSYSDSFKPFEYFEIPFFQIHFWYLGIIEIIKSYTGQKDKTRDLIVSLEPNINYFWILLESKNISFAIEVNNNITFKAHFTICQFNNFILALKDLIFYTLHLKPFEFYLFNEAAGLSLEEILRLKDNTFSNNFIQKILQNLERLDLVPQIPKYQILLSYYLELITLKHKFSSLYNPGENLSDKIICLIVSDQD